MSAGWVFVIVAGLLEIGWIISLKHTAGFTRLVPILWYAAFGAGSTWFLSLGMKQVPMATAYIIWMGIGLLGAAIHDAVWAREPMPWLKIISMLLIVAGAAGVRISDANATRQATPAAEQPAAASDADDDLRAAVGD